MEVRPIRAGEERAAGALVYEVTRGEKPGERQLTAFLDQARALGSDLSLQVVALTGDGSIVGCVAYFPMPDRTATATPPLCTGRFARPELQAQLMRGLKAKAAADGLLMIQVFCERDDDKLRDILTRSGFKLLAVMLFMDRPVTGRDREIRVDPQIRWVPYSVERHDDFARVVEATYEGTLDGAGLAEVRDVKLTLEAYRSRGEFDPQLWLLAEVRGVAIGCLLLLHHVEQADYEVGYVGVVPEHRGKGFGRKLMEKGLREVALRRPAGTLTLAVDAENFPAVNVYDELGFRVRERRDVYFSLLDTP